MCIFRPLQLCTLRVPLNLVITHTKDPKDPNIDLPWNSVLFYFIIKKKKNGTNHARSMGLILLYIITYCIYSLSVVPADSSGAGAQAYSRNVCFDNTMALMVSFVPK